MADITKTPRHIAIIMDGNGRWAKSRGLPRTAGHKKGLEAVKKTVMAADELGVEYLTLFGFSSENWSRPIEEVKELMRLLRLYLRSETAELHRNNVKLRVIGNRDQLEKDIVKLINNAEELMIDNTGITLTIAINYGGRNDIMQAASNWAKMCNNKGIDPDIKVAEEFFSSFLSTSYAPDPDILIRTSGEERISNFLLWQCAYSEFIFMDCLWPDFGRETLESAIEEYSLRERRYGSVKTTDKTRGNA
jgi:undecaprenyl diphosphate synthase